MFIAMAAAQLDPNTDNYGDFSGGPGSRLQRLLRVPENFPDDTKLASAPADADLVFEISFAEFPVPLYAERRRHANVADAKFRLVILDPKTHVTLWTITEYVGGAILQGNREKNLFKPWAASSPTCKRSRLSAPPTSPARSHKLGTPALGSRQPCRIARYGTNDETPLTAVAKPVRMWASKGGKKDGRNGMTTLRALW